MSGLVASGSGRESLERKLAELRHFLLYLGERLVRDNCLNNAATLSYTTLLSIVPLMAVAFSVLAAFPVFEPFNERIRSFVLANLVPASSQAVGVYLERFAEKAASLTAAGVAGLLVSAVLMMSAVDKALNDIWHVHQRRSMLQGFMIYWTLLTVGPLLLGVSFGLTSYLESLQALSPFSLSLPKKIALALMPFVAEVLAFLFLYAAVPNRRVPIRHAAVGAVVAASLFELAKAGFAWYVTSFPTYEAIYGALAALPVFLIWVYLSWVVILLGGEFTQALSGYRVGRAGGLADPRWQLLLAVRVLGHLYRAQSRGYTLSRRRLALAEPTAGERSLQDCLHSLARARVVHRVERGGYVLARDLHQFTLLDLYRSQPFVLPEPGVDWRVHDCSAEQPLAAILHSAADRLHAVLDVPLAELVAAAARREEEIEGMVGKRYLVAGVVQGVGYRASVREKAQDLAIEGYARNLPDGRVEVIGVGPVAALDALEAWLWQGPPQAKVAAVEIEDIEPPSVEGFSIR